MKQVFIIFTTMPEWDVVAVFDSLEAAQDASKGSTIHVIKSYTIGSFKEGIFKKMTHNSY